MIKNFRSISNLTIDADGHDVIISGPNGAGKSTIELAYNWCLFGSGGNDSHIPTGTPMQPTDATGIEPTVEVIFSIDGTERKFKRVYAEKFIERGSRKGEFDGREVHYYIDDVEVKAKQYAAAVAEIAQTEEQAKLSSDPLYFFNMGDDKATRAKKYAIISTLAGELNVTEPAELIQMRGSKSVEIFKEYSQQQQKIKDKQLTQKQADIRAARDILGNYSAVQGDPKALEKEISDLKVERSELEYQQRNLDKNGAADAKRQEITKVQGDIATARVTFQEQLDAENAKVRDGIAKLENERSDLVKADGMVQNRIDRLENHIKTYSEYRQKKLDEYKALNADYKAEQAQQYDGSDTCPLCGQTLPTDQVATAQAKYNAEKAQNLESIRKKIDANVAEGKQIKADLEKSQAELTDLQIKHEDTQKQIDTLDVRIEKGRGMIKQGNFADTEIAKSLNSKLAQLQAELAAGTNDADKSAKYTELQEQIIEIDHKIDAADNTLRFLKQKTDQQEKVNGLMAEEKAISAEMEQHERAIAACEDYTKVRIKALEQAVNSKFKLVRFSFYEDLKGTDGEKEVCKVVLPNGSKQPSTGEMIQAGADIATTLAEFYGIQLPMWIDNAEGLTLPLHTDAQQIRMYVRDDIENLKIEVSEDD
jgi:DNA repair exonuclease SbcCD ATPase subunit